MINGDRGVYEILHYCYFSKNRSAAASLFAINNGFPIVQFMCQPFFKHHSAKLFWNNLQILSVRKGRFFRPLKPLTLTEFQQLLRAPLPNPFRDFGSSGVLT